MATVEDLFIAGPVGRLSVRTKGLSDHPGKVVVLVQGSNLTGQSMFDFSFPGGDYSVMDRINAMGFGAVTFAIRGYGASDLPHDPFTVTTETAMEDLGAVMDWVIGRGYARPHLLGFSWGGRIAGRWAEDNADKLDRLVLYDPARGGGNPVLPAPTNNWFDNTPEFYMQKFEPEFTALDLRQALAAHVQAHDRKAPNGIRLENASPVPPIDPTRITRPTLLVYGGEAAKASYMHGGLDRATFFEKLATDDKTFSILPGGGDFIHFQQGRHRFYKALRDFLVMEPAQ